MSPASSNDTGTSGQPEPIRPRVVLERIAPEQAGILENLAELYAHDFSEHVPLELKPNGRFDVDFGEQWWSDGHHAFFIRCDEKLCGFVLVKRGSKFTGAKDVMDVAEFFVVRGARRRRIGATVARHLFSVFPGRWEIRVRQSNGAALEFWSRAVEEWLGQPAAKTHVSFEGVAWLVFRIDSRRNV